MDLAAGRILPIFDPFAALTGFPDLGLYPVRHGTADTGL
jgi:hypothetical protein